MITVNLKGGLGNQLFQYAFGRRLSLLRGEELVLDLDGLKADEVTKREYALKPFKLSEKIKTVNSGHKESVLSILKKKILKQYNIGYNSKLLYSKDDYFEGFFQSHKYLDPIRDVLLQEVSLVEPIDSKHQSLLSRIDNCNSVSVHVRRGDYVNDAKTKLAHYTFGLEYYQKAFEIVLEKIDSPVFFVFSDDIQWAKDNLGLDTEAVFVSNPEMKDCEELIIMSRCKNNIIANSSFSFWAAWLNQNDNKMVIAPKKWNNLYNKAYKDLLPDNWLKI